jgi:hypothetical protein
MRQLCLVLTGCLLLFLNPLRSQTLPTGFSASTVGSGWNLPLGTAFTNDGQKLFVWEKDGRVYVCNRDANGNYVKQATPVLDISEEVANWGDHGLMGFALDPNYLSNGLIYCLYVVDRYYLLNFGTPGYNASQSSTGATIGRITRFKTITSGSNLTTDPASRKILLGESKTTGICIMHDSHGLGTLAFAADGTLLATAGDGGSYYLVDKGSDTDTDFDQALQDGIIRPAENVGAFRAQMLNSHNGKLLRIDPNTGDGVSSNPYYDASAPRSPKSRVWAFGLRNPYRFSIKAGTGSTNPAAGDVGEIYVGDVGWNTYEEVNIISAPGVNCGWPLFEGLTPQPGYMAAVTANQDEPNPLYNVNGCTKRYFNFQDLIKQATADNNKTLFNSCNTSTAIGTGNRYFHQRPAIDWKHFTDSARVGTFTGNTATFAQIGTPQSNVVGAPFPGNCATGGPWYNGTNFPEAYRNRYYVADHDANWIRCFSVDFTDVITEVKTFGTGFSGIVNLNVNPLDGTLVVVELGNFASIPTTIKQIKYGGNQTPIAKASSDKTFGPAPLAINFNGSGSSDADGTIASYQWNFGDGGTSTSANPSHTFNAPANTPTKFVVKLTVTDNQGASATDSIIVSANNTPPKINITSPVKNSLYKIGPDTLYTCSAIVTDDEHAAGTLKYEWQSFLRHNSHAHPEQISNAVSPTTNISRLGCNGDTYYWLIKLTVTDPAGLSAVDSSKIFPDCNVGPDETPPTITSVLPLDAATNVAHATTVSAIFSEAVDPSSVTISTFKLRDAANNPVSGTVTVSGNQAIFTPAASLAGTTTYTAAITGGLSGVEDLAGNLLAENYAWSFTTAVLDVTPPVINSVTPLNGATGVGVGVSVSATFSEAVNASTVTNTTFELRDASNALVNATVSTSGNQIILTPLSSLNGSTVYTARVKSGTNGVKDLSGNALAADYTWSFTTAAVTYVAVSIQSADSKTGTGPTTHALTAVPPGALLVLSTTSDAFPADASVASTPALTWTKRVDAQATSSDNAEIWTAVYPAGGTISVTSNWGATSQASVCYVVLNAETNLTGAFATAVTQASPSVTVTTTREQSILFGCTADWKAVNGATRTLRDAATERLYYKDGNYTTYHYTKAATAIGSYTEGVSAPTGQQASTAVLEIRGNPIPVDIPPTVTVHPLSQAKCVGADASFTSSATGTPNPTVQWQVSTTNGTSWSNIGGATDPTLTFATTPGDNNKQYRAAWTNASSTAYSNAATLTVNNIPAMPVIDVVNNCTNSVLTASGYTGTLLWNTNATTPAITVLNGGTYSVVQTVNGCSSFPASAVAAPYPIPPAPSITVTNQCGQTLLTATNYTGILNWSTGAASESITVSSAGTYTLSQTINGCTSTTTNAVAAPLAVPAAPTVAVENKCGNSILTATGYTGTLLWSTGSTANQITVTQAGSYSVTQTVNGCTSPDGIGAAAPLNANVPAPVVDVVDFCDHSVLTATNVTGSLLWSTGETAAAITVTTAGNYSVIQTVDGCNSPASGKAATPINSTIPAPTILLSNECGKSLLTAQNFTGSLLWSNNETNASFYVTDAATYSVTQTINGCTGTAASIVTAPKEIPAAPSVNVVNNCGNSVLTASSFTGSLTWSTGETVNPITVTTGGPYMVTQTVDGCTSQAATANAVPVNADVPSPTIDVVNVCGNSVMTASNFTGSLLWSTGESGPSINANTAGNYSVVQFVNGCPSIAAVAQANPKPIPVAPHIEVNNLCESSNLTATNYTGSLLWSTGETSSTIAVNIAGSYSVTQSLDGCTSLPTSATAVPKPIPSMPGINVVNSCGSSTLTATNYTGTLAWSNGANTPSITVSVAGDYTVTQTINGCTSQPGTGTAAPINAVVNKPVIEVVNDCTTTTFTATGYTGTLLWSTGETSSSIIVATPGTYTLNQTVNGCTSPDAIATAAPIHSTIAAPNVAVENNCGYSVLTASAYTGLLLWSNNETSASINVNTAGTYTVAQIINGCTGASASINAAPKTIPAAPSIAVADNCGLSTLTALNVTGAVLWSNGATTTINAVTEAGSYTVQQTVNGCVSAPVAAEANPKPIPAAPSVTVTDNCGNSTLTAGSYTGTLLWSNNATTASTIVTAAGPYTLTQTLNGCVSPAATGNANPKPIPVLSGSLAANAVSGAAFSYAPASATPGTTFTWTRAVVNGISNAASNGNDGISETLINTTGSPVIVTYQYTLNANGCTNIQNLAVTVSSSLQVTSVNPANGATGVSTMPSVTANFSESINSTTVNASTVQLKDALGNVISSSITAGTSQLTIIPAVALNNAAVYTVTLKGGTSGIKGAIGNGLVSDYSWSFTTTAAAPQPPVTIQSVNTKTGTSATSHALTAVPAGALLVLTTTSDAFPSNALVSSTPALTWTKRVDAGATSSDNAEIWTASFATGGSITVSSSWGAGTSQTSVCYVVVNAEPTLAGAFATAVSQASPSVNITTTKENGIVFGCTADWKAINGATRTLRDAATERLYYRDGNYTTYHYTKSTTTIGTYTEGVSAPTGQQAATALLEIRSAVVVPDNTPPNIVSVTPSHASVDQPLNTIPTATFSESMDATTINSTSVELRDASNALVAATVSYNSSTKVATIAPSVTLAYAMVYTVTIKNGVNGVKDLAGNAMTTNYSWSFTTLNPDLTPPTITAVTPANGAGSVSITVAPTVVFSETMNATTISNAAIEMRNSSNTLISISISYNAATRTATLTPAAALANLSTYSVTVKGGPAGVKDASNNALVSDYSWSFTTTEAPPQQPVTIQSVTTKTGNAATTHALTGVPAGALLVLATTSDAVPSNAVVSSTPALTWTKRVDAGATSSDNSEIWTALFTAGGTITVTSNWGGDVSQASVCYVVLNAEPTLSGAFATAVTQASPSVAITTTRESSIIFGCTADWKAVNGATRTLRDAASERLYYRDGNYTTYFYTKSAATVATYTEGISAPTGQQAATALLEIRSAAAPGLRPAAPSIVVSNNPVLKDHSLGQNYPNPFEGVTHIPFTLASPEKVSLVLYDIHGRIVKVLLNGSMDKGKHVVKFRPGLLAGGIYYYRLNAGAFSDVKKLVIW